MDKPIRGGVGVFGSAAAYALVWEFGSLTMEKPGPKTLWGTNPKGERAILTKQAPEGYVAIHDDDLFKIMVAELKGAKLIGNNADETRILLEVVTDNISQAWAKVIADSAPVDSGDLRSQIQYIDSGDDLLSEGVSGAAQAEATFFF